MRLREQSKPKPSETCDCSIGEHKISFVDCGVCCATYASNNVLSTGQEISMNDDLDTNRKDGIERVTGAGHDDVATRLRTVRTMLHATVGQVVLAMSAVPRYRNQALADISHLVIDPLIRDRIAIAHAAPKADETETPLSPAAVAIWASVSHDVDDKIREQIKSNAFPVRLKADEWNSGDIVWLLDVIAPSREMATSVLSNFSKVAKTETVKIHPMITQLVDPEVLGKLIVKANPTNSGDAPKPSLN